MLVSQGYRRARHRDRAFTCRRRTRGGVPVEVGHEVMRLLHVHPERALVQIGNQNAVAFPRDPKRVRLDRLRHPPPFLHDDHPGSCGVTAHVAGKVVPERDFLHRSPGRNLRSAVLRGARARSVMKDEEGKVSNCFSDAPTHAPRAAFGLSHLGRWLTRRPRRSHRRLLPRLRRPRLFPPRAPRPRGDWTRALRRASRPRPPRRVGGRLAGCSARSSAGRPPRCAWT